MDVNSLNTCSFSGTIVDIKDDRSGCIMYLRQVVAGTFDTVIAVYIIPALKARFKSLALKPGEFVHVINGQIYQKENVVRVRITSPSQLPQRPCFNMVSFTGTIIERTEEGKGILYSVRQNVGGKIPTIFDVFIPESIREEIEDKFSVSEDVFISNGILYTKEGLLRVKVSSPAQFQKLQEDFCLGEEEARDKFI